MRVIRRLSLPRGKNIMGYGIKCIWIVGQLLHLFLLLHVYKWLMVFWWLNSNWFSWCLSFRVNMCFVRFSKRKAQAQEIMPNTEHHLRRKSGLMVCLSLPLCCLITIAIHLLLAPHNWTARHLNHVFLKLCHPSVWRFHQFKAIMLIQMSYLRFWVMMFCFQHHWFQMKIKKIRCVTSLPFFLTSVPDLVTMGILSRLYFLMHIVSLWT